MHMPPRSRRAGRARTCTRPVWTAARERVRGVAPRYGFVTLERKR
jgi:hypothetical protein